MLSMQCNQIVFLVTYSFDYTEENGLSFINVFYHPSPMNRRNGSQCTKEQVKQRLPLGFLQWIFSYIRIRVTETCIFFSSSELFVSKKIDKYRILLKIGVSRYMHQFNF